MCTHSMFQIHSVESRLPSKSSTDKRTSMGLQVSPKVIFGDGICRRQVGLSGADFLFMFICKNSPSFPVYIKPFAGVVTQIVECLSRKSKALSSNSNTTKKKETTKFRFFNAVKIQSKKTAIRILLSMKPIFWGTGVF